MFLSKKLLSLFLAFATLLTCLSGVTMSYAAENVQVKESETIIIEGNTYKYEEVIENGKEYTRIINLTKNTEDILYYDTSKDTFYLNDEPVAHVEVETTKTSDTTNDGITPFAKTGWRYHDTSTTKISWIKGVSASILAGIIAEVIPATGTVTVLMKIGVKTLGTIAGACVGGTVKCVAYTQTLLDGKVQCRYDWTFKPRTGETYGPYRSYQL